MEPRRSPANVPAGRVTAPLTTFRGSRMRLSARSASSSSARALAFLMLAMISFYQLPEFVSGPIVTPTTTTSVSRRTSWVPCVRPSAPSATIVGIAAGGFAAVRFGYLWTLIAGVIIKMLVIANFATLVWIGADARLFSAVMFADNPGVGFAGVALCDVYVHADERRLHRDAVRASARPYTYIGKFAKGFSGVMVEHLAAGRTLLDGYALFFIACGLLGLPALVLCLVLASGDTARAQSGRHSGMIPRALVVASWLSGVSLAACSSPPAAVPPGAIIVGVRTGPNNIDPRIGSDETSERIGELVFNTCCSKSATTCG